MSRPLHNFSRKVTLFQFTLKIKASNNLSPLAVKNIFKSTERGYSLLKVNIFESHRIHSICNIYRGENLVTNCKWFDIRHGHLYLTELIIITKITIISGDWG